MNRWAPAPEDFGSRLRGLATTARVGTWLGICFGTCFLTGLISHYAQNVDQPIPFPTSPAWGYQATQGLHVLSGTAAVPLLGAPPESTVGVFSLQESGAFNSSVLQGNFAADERTLLALSLAGEPLGLDHGYPARVIAPNRPGVLQTKWVSRLEVIS